MKKYKIMSVFGTRPEAIKMAPLVKALARCPDLESICCLTGQPGRCSIPSWRSSTSAAISTSISWSSGRPCPPSPPRPLLGMEQVMEQCRPDMILVHGDTSTTFAGRWRPFTHQVPVAMWRPAFAPMISIRPSPRR